ncbi:MAG: ribosomal L7Ae/L30e/S12e/Gadd45 family protein [Nitrososphaerota archaeon]|jgi:large subunit ribosomal protein L30e|nr:ribosomal L7Ae/L30e/S12e/Gadd45 family protein [Nitrososphaerota archaeon]
MSEHVELERQLKKASKTGKYVVGRREVMSAVKGSKLLVWSASANLPQKILDDCRSLSIPALKFNGNPVELGRACGIPFRVSVIAVKSAGDADLKSFTNSADYGLVSHTPAVKEEPAESAPKKESKAVRKKKTKAETGSEEKEKAAVKKTTRKKKTAEEKEKA